MEDRVGGPALSDGGMAPSPAIREADTLRLFRRVGIDAILNSRRFRSL